MEDQRVGAAFRAARIRRRLRQSDLAVAAGTSRGSVSRIERGHFDTLALRTVRAVATVLEIRLQLVPRWRGGELDRLLSARHSALHESVARAFRATWPDWIMVPEVSFSIWGERGIIDVLAWHAQRRALLVIELKTEIVDANELIGTIDRKRRLAGEVARERGWEAASTSVWVIVSASRTNRRRIEAHGAMLRAAFPTRGRAIRPWLRAPKGPIAALSSWTDSDRSGRGLAPIARVRARGPRLQAGRGAERCRSKRSNARPRIIGTRRRAPERPEASRPSTFERARDRGGGP